MPITDTIWINGRSCEDMKFYPATVRGILFGQSVDYTEAYLPGAAGMAVLSSEGQLKPREITIEGRIEVATYDLLFPTIQEFLSWVFFGPLEVYTERDKSKVYYGRVVDQPILAYDPELLSVDAYVSVKIRCSDPMVYDRAPLVLGFNSTPSEITVGTGWTSGIIRLTDCTAPIVHVKTASGLLVQKLEFTSLGGLSVSSTEFITIDSIARRITKTSGGAVTQVGSYLSPASDFPMVISPSDGTPDNPPTIEVFGTGTPVGELVYRRTYL